MPRNNPDHYKLSGSRKEDPQRAAVSRARLGAQASWKRQEAWSKQNGRPAVPQSKAGASEGDKGAES